MSVEVEQITHQEAVLQCPFMSGIFAPQSLAFQRSTSKCPSAQTPTKNNSQKPAKDVGPQYITSYQSTVPSEAFFQEKKGPTLVTTPDLHSGDKIQLSPRLSELLEGIDEHGISNNPLEPPEWFNYELFECGRRFYERYLFCLSFSDLLSLVLFLSRKHVLLPLIYTRRSDNPMKALKRYFSTLCHLITWFRGDIWDPNDDAHKDILSIRSTHDRLGGVFNTSTNSVEIADISVHKMGYPEPSDSLNSTIRQDLQHIMNSQLPKVPEDFPLYISQFDMSLTQYSFMGLMVAHPDKLGAAGATEEDMAGLIHFWRCIGWLLGIRDKYNFCNGTVAETRALCLEVERNMAIPCLAAANWDYEHMTSSLITGMGYIIPCMSYPAMVRYLSYTVGIPFPAFVSKMSFRDTYNYWVMRVAFGLCSLFPRFVGIMTGLVNRMVHMVNKSCRWKRLAMTGNGKLAGAYAEQSS